MPFIRLRKFYSVSSFLWVYHKWVQNSVEYFLHLLKCIRGFALYSVNMAVLHTLFPGEGNGNPLQYSCLENSMDGGTWWAVVMGSQRVRHNWATNTHKTHIYIVILDLKWACVTGRNITWSLWFIILFLCCWIFANGLLRIFASILINIIYIVLFSHNMLVWLLLSR